MVYRITGGIFLILLSFNMLGVTAIPQQITGVFGLIAGIALLAGV